jgi:arabinogalactan endo-1,4-beta-galactosidase
MLWLDGKDWGPRHDFKNLAALLKSARRGVIDGSGSSPRPLIMIHIDRGADWKGTKWFFDGMRAEGVDYDIIGESYYPQFHGPISKLKETLTNAAMRYHKPILVTETAYPFKDNGQGPNPAMTYPKTPAGQQQFMHDLVALVHRTPNGLGRGVLYWEPEWLPTKGFGGAWNTTALFDDAGNALPAFDVYSHH